ncbi:DUF1819 family protein [Gottfriedia sp. S16(2024)]|uniref:DUF1819 family protein n=1 Tax=Gottfriedia sp. S16(2024) TaxID=3162883 RepID=UPI003D2467DE
MVKDLKYRSTIKSRPLFFFEMKKAASLVNKGISIAQLKDLVINENIFQVNTEARKKEIASTVIGRLEKLDDYLIQQIAEADVETSKLLVLYSVLKTDRLFFEFLDEVIKDKRTLKDYLLTDKDFNIFFHRKREESEVVSRWQDYTFYKLQQVYIRILFEVGILKNQKDEREIEVPFFNEDVKNHLKEFGDEHFVHLLVGETA